MMSEVIPALSIAALPAVIAKCRAGTSFKAPRKSPIAVLQALTITTSFKPIYALLVRKKDSPVNVRVPSTLPYFSRQFLINYHNKFSATIELMTHDSKNAQA
jgi:hypothetical protein